MKKLTHRVPNENDATRPLFSRLDARKQAQNVVDTVLDVRRLVVKYWTVETAQLAVKVNCKKLERDGTGTLDS